MLARAVYSEVSDAALYGPGGSGPWHLAPRSVDVLECRSTARTVSRAFSSALRSAGYIVDWGESGDSRGDYCLSAFLSQCYPNRDIGTEVMSRADTNFVRSAWNVVSHSVMREMANPFSSDEVRFNSDRLKLRLGLSLRSIAAVPEDQAIVE